MRKLLNSLYITQPDVTIGKDGTNLVIYKDSEKIAQFPVQYFENVVCFNYTGVSPAAMALCIENNTGISFLSPQGKFQGRVEGRISGNVLLRREQFRLADDEYRSLKLAKVFVSSKIFNSIKVLSRGIHDHPDKGIELGEIISNLKNSSKTKIEEANGFDVLLGIEGDTSREYFKGYRKLITNQIDDFQFNGRNRRPPTDPINAMLSFSYGMVRTLMQNALNVVGLDPYVGFYHQDRPGRSGLALDMMEEFRPFLADKFVLKLINLKQITINDFFIKGNGACLFTEEGMKKYLDLWNKRLQETLEHPFIEETIPIGLIPYVQSMLMARYIRGDIDQYPPFLIN